MNNRANYRDQPLGRDIASEDAFRLASLEERDELSRHWEVSAPQFLRGEPSHVDGQNSVELAELFPGGKKDSLQRLLRLATIRLGVRLYVKSQLPLPLFSVAPSAGAVDAQVITGLFELATAAAVTKTDARTANKKTK